MSNMLTEVQKKTKSFWDTKEGTTGMILGAGLLGLIGWGLYTIMPFIANLMENTFYAILFGLLSVSLVYVTVIDGTLRNRLWMSYKLLMRALTYSIISYDPIGVLREIQKKAKERLTHVDECRTKVNGQKRQIQNAVEGFESDITKLTRLIEAKQRNNPNDPTINNELAKLGRVNEAKVRLKVAADRIEGFYTQLTRALTALNTIHDNIDFEINIVEREYKATNAAHDAWKSVKEAFKGDAEFDELGSTTWAFLAEDYGNKLGEIETFMQDSTKFIDNVDLTNAGYAEEGMKMLEKLNGRNIEGIVTPTAQITNKQAAVIIPQFAAATTVNYAEITKR